MKINGFYFITDSKLSRAGNLSDVRNALAAGVTIVQYRSKDRPLSEMLDEALKLRKICKDIIFLINDRVDIALSVGADGVHIGNGDMAYSMARKLLGRKGIIGVTAHNIEEAKRAERLGADYIGISPIFTTGTKKDAGSPIGVGMIKRIHKIVSLPIVAIGGISLANAKKVIASGADAICAISAVITRPDVKKEVLKYQRLFK